MLLVFFTACTATSAGPTVADSKDPTDTSVDSAGDTSPDSGVELHGDVPAVALAAPEFAATSDAGLPRTRDDLLGHPTVVWFYPAAATSG